jgi:hypothetical protein
MVALTLLALTSIVDLMPCNELQIAMDNFTNILQTETSEFASCCSKIYKL